MDEEIRALLVLVDFTESNSTGPEVVGTGGFACGLLGVGCCCTLSLSLSCCVLLLSHCAHRCHAPLSSLLRRALSSSFDVVACRCHCCCVPMHRCCRCTVMLLPRSGTILYSLDSTLNPLRILNGWAHLDGRHIIGKRLMRAFERW